MTRHLAAVPAAGDEYVDFCEGVRRICAIDLLQYKRGQMERRIRTFVTARGHAALEDGGQAAHRTVQGSRTSSASASSHSAAHALADSDSEILAAPRGVLRKWSRAALSAMTSSQFLAFYDSASQAA